MNNSSPKLISADGRSFEFKISKESTDTLDISLSDKEEPLSIYSSKQTFTSLVGSSKSWNIFDTVEEIKSFLERLIREGVKPTVEVLKPNVEAGKSTIEPEDKGQKDGENGEEALQLVFYEEFKGKKLCFPIEFKKSTPKDWKEKCEKVLESHFKYVKETKIMVADLTKELESKNLMINELKKNLSDLRSELQKNGEAIKKESGIKLPETPVFSKIPAQVPLENKKNNNKLLWSVTSSKYGFQYILSEDLLTAKKISDDEIITTVRSQAAFLSNGRTQIALKIVNILDNDYMVGIGPDIVQKGAWFYFPDCAAISDKGIYVDGKYIIEYKDGGFINKDQTIVLDVEIVTASKSLKIGFILDGVLIGDYFKMRAASDVFLLFAARRVGSEITILDQM